MSYKKVVISAFGGIENLDIVEDDLLPEPSNGQVRIKILAAGTGFTDTIIRRGQYIDVKDKPPFVIGYDWYGTVDKLGANVNDFSVGDFVADMPVIGGYSEYICTDASQLVKAPAGLDPAEAVSMILSYTTAYQMLTRIQELPPGTSCLVHAAGGAVGTALLELGKLMQLKLYATASAGKKDLVEGFGAHHIDYRKQNFVDVIRQHEKQGVDVVFDTLGGKSWSQSYSCLKKGGVLIAFGALQFTAKQESLASLLWGFSKLGLWWKLRPDGKRAVFYNIQKRREKLPDEFKADVEALFDLLKEKKLSPAIADRLNLEDAREAHRRIEAADVLGKIVLLTKHAKAQE